MSDLNQMMHKAKSGIPPENYRAIMTLLIARYETNKRNNVEGGPICCFYTSKSGAIPSYARLDGFRNHAEWDHELVIGCSRGCIPIRRKGAADVAKRYAEKLCRNCVKDAKKLLVG